MSSNKQFDHGAQLITKSNTDLQLQRYQIQIHNCWFSDQFKSWSMGKCIWW